MEYPGQRGIATGTCSYFAACCSLRSYLVNDLIRRRNFVVPSGKELRGMAVMGSVSM